MTRHNDKVKIREFYDLVSSHFHDLWGKHLHHGYWIRGDETKERAQIQLIEHLAQTASVRSGQTILDVGCGTGASSIYLAKQYKLEATGITISPVQVDLAKKAAALEGVNATFLLMDAEAMKSNGTLAVIDWFKRENLNPVEYKQDIIPIEKGMLVELGTMQEYEAWMRSNGLKIIKSEILNKNCAKTWDLGLDIIKNKSLWKLAATKGAMFVNFLKAFRAMRAGFASGKFVYGLVVAQKI